MGPPCKWIDYLTGEEYVENPPTNRLIRCVFVKHNPLDYPELYHRYGHLAGHQNPDPYVLEDNFVGFDIEKGEMPDIIKQDYLY
jgi:hypothetical protein